MRPPADEPEPRVVFVDYLPDSVEAYSRDDPAEIVVNRRAWDQMSDAGQRALLAHERGHFDTATFRPVGMDTDEGTMLWLEAKADRAGLERLIPDWQVGEALRMGCREPYEFAEAWNVDELTARERLAVYSPLAFRR